MCIRQPSSKVLIRESEVVDECFESFLHLFLLLCFPPNLDKSITSEALFSCSWSAIDAIEINFHKKIWDFSSTILGFEDFFGV